MIGRKHETEKLLRAYRSEQSEFVAVYGRRRIGKTFLINETFQSQFSFHHAGVENASMTNQLEFFRMSLKRQGLPQCPRLKNWLDAFFQLETLLEASSKVRKVVFLDELPWFDTPKSSFLCAFEHFWNSWACLRHDILLIICGSATSWLVKKVFRARGGLHNRVTMQIPLQPFTLKECEEYADYRQLGFNRAQIAECYMALGGVAYYWNLLEAGKSAIQNYDNLFFAEDAEMPQEFKRLFSSLFKNEGQYVEIITLLAGHKSGMTREELREALSNAGGELTTHLEELEECGFIRHYSSIGKQTKGCLFQLIDSYTLFYFLFIRQRRGNDGSFWSHTYSSGAANAWRGLAFERLCLLHVQQIKHALGISGILADVYSWRSKSASENDRRVQIDLLIDRGDNTINLCEMKYTDMPYALDAEEANRIQTRANVFREQTGTRKAIQTTLVASAGLKPGKYNGCINSVITLDDLFM